MYLNRTPGDRGSDNFAKTRAGGFKASKVVEAGQPGRAPLVSEFPRLNTTKPSAPSVGALLDFLRQKVPRPSPPSLLPTASPPSLLALLSPRLLLSGHLFPLPPPPQVVQFNLCVADFFGDYDAHSLGVITLAQFRQGMANAFGKPYARVEVTAEELLLLEEAYSKRIPNQPVPTQGFAWSAFCNDLDVVRVVPNLDRDPHGESIDTAAMGERQPVSLSEADEARTGQLLAAIRERFRVCSVYAKAPFADFAKNSNSPLMVDHVSRQQFVQALASLGINMSAGDLELFFLKYDDDGEGNVNFVSFCRDVDVLETHSNRSKKPDPNHKPLYGGFRTPHAPEDLVGHSTAPRPF